MRTAGGFKAQRPATEEIAGLYKNSRCSCDTNTGCLGSGADSNGSMIAIFPDGRLISGWFYIETGNVDICKSGIDCDRVFYYETRYKRSRLWTYAVSNNEINTKIFVGPIITNQVNTMFKKKFRDQIH